MVGMSGLLGLHRAAVSPQESPLWTLALDWGVITSLGVLWVGTVLSLLSLARYVPDHACAAHGNVCVSSPLAAVRSVPRIAHTIASQPLHNMQILGFLLALRLNP